MKHSNGDILTQSEALDLAVYMLNTIRDGRSFHSTEYVQMLLCIFEARNQTEDRVLDAATNNRREWPGNLSESDLHADDVPAPFDAYDYHGVRRSDF